MGNKGSLGALLFLIVMLVVAYVAYAVATNAFKLAAPPQHLITVSGHVSTAALLTKPDHITFTQLDTGQSYTVPIADGLYSLGIYSDHAYNASVYYQAIQGVITSANCQRALNLTYVSNSTYVYNISC